MHSFSRDVHFINKHSFGPFSSLVPLVAFIFAMATTGATCDYCSELFTDPRMLPCLHSFCAQCLAKVSEIKGEKEALQCPTCNEKAPLPEGGVNAFPKDLRKSYEAEVAQCSLKVKSGKENCDDCGRSVVVAFCVNCCEFLCKSCDDHHRLSRKTKKHEILATGEKMGKENEESVLATILSSRYIVLFTQMKC